MLIVKMYMKCVYRMGSNQCLPRIMRAQGRMCNFKKNMRVYRLIAGLERTIDSTRPTPLSENKLLYNGILT